jgi:hypothetical protein
MSRERNSAAALEPKVSVPRAFEMAAKVTLENLENDAAAQLLSLLLFLHLPNCELQRQFITIDRRITPAHAG